MIIVFISTVGFQRLEGEFIIILSFFLPEYKILFILSKSFTDYITTNFSFCRLYFNFSFAVN